MDDMAIDLEGEPESIEPYMAPIIAPTETAVTIFGLKLATCRFPLWGDRVPAIEEAFYCGAPAMDDQPYCHAHYKATHYESQPRKR